MSPVYAARPQKYVSSEKTNSVHAPNWVETALVSDDGVEFCALDLPGVCDAEDKSAAFDTMTLEWAAKCDVLVWVTDARTALSTKHEVSAFKRIQDGMREKSDEDGTVYQMLIVLAKYEEPRAPHDIPPEYLPGEIRRRAEDSTDSTDSTAERRAVRAFPETRVAKFNAFARIATRSTSSAALRDLVSCISTGSYRANSTSFDLGWATENLVEKRLAQMSRVLRAARRAIAALSALAPVYDTPIELACTFRRYLNNNASSTLLEEGRLCTILVMFDRAAFDCARFTASVTETASWRLDKEKRMIDIGHWGTNSSYCGFEVGQIHVPLVRPVYGDVLIDPQRIVACANRSEVRLSLTSKFVSIYIGDEPAQMYGLKVGEVSRDNVASLLWAMDKLPPQSLCGVTVSDMKACKK